MQGSISKFIIVIELDGTPTKGDWTSEAVKANNIFLSSTNAVKSTSKEVVTEKELSKITQSSRDYRESHLYITNIDYKEGMTESKSLSAKYMGYGVVKLYREYENPDKQCDESVEVQSDDTTVAIIAVPNYFTPTDLLGFLGEKVISDVSHIRMIKSDNPNRFMVLMKFKKTERAREFQDQFNGKVFSSMESEVCRTIFVKSVIFKPLSSPGEQSNIPFLVEDPFTLQMKRSITKDGDSRSSVIKELPTCPVCLERMDSEITGLLTISCQHTFHGNCLSKWRDDTCPVCRYSNLSLSSLKVKDLSEQACYICHRSQNLWICLICGHMGCGRYDLKHAIQHYESTNHCFAMDITTRRVWDYAGDNYVHRLIQNESDGKIVEVETVSSACSIASSEKDKDSGYNLEYSNVLLSQLESQRDYYEARLSESASNLAINQKDLEIKSSKLESFESKLEALTSKVLDLETDHYKRIDMLNQKNDYISTLKRLAQSMEKKWKDEALISSNLTTNLEELKKANIELKADKEDLESQVKDLMFYLESREKFKDATEEVVNGTVLVQPGATSSKSHKKKKNIKG